MNHARILTALCAAVMPFALAFAVQGCDKKDDDMPPPQPSVAPTPTPAPTPTAPLALQPEVDAGSDAAEDATADAAPKATGGGDPTGIRKCCAALRQNANSAPLDQKGSYLSAAAICDGLVNSPQGRSALGAVRGALRGANMPSSCQ